MRESAEAFGVHLNKTPIETSGYIRTVERYQHLLRLAYELNGTDTDHQTSDQERLRLAVFAVKCTVGPEGLCLVLPAMGLFRRQPGYSQHHRN